VTKWTNLLGLEDVFVANYRAAVFDCRTIVWKQKNSRTFVFSPGQDLPESFRDERYSGDEYLVLFAPCSFHNMGVLQWRKMFQKGTHITINCFESALKRLKKVCSKDIEVLDIDEKHFPDHIRLIEVPFSKIGESWIMLETPEGKALVVTDAFMNIYGRPFNILFHLAFRWAGIGAGLSCSKVFSKFCVNDGPAYAKWFAEFIEKEQPTILIPNHGKILRDENLAKTLTAVVNKRFKIES
jgi:hypothetical protein